MATCCRTSTGATSTQARTKTRPHPMKMGRGTSNPAKAPAPWDKVYLFKWVKVLAPDLLPTAADFARQDCGHPIVVALLSMQQQYATSLQG